MMLRTLYAKLAAVLIGLLITLGVLYATFNLYTTKLFLQELNQRFNRDLARQLLVQQNLAADELLDERQVKAIFSYYMHINPAIEIYLLDTEGRILAFEAPQSRVKRQQVALAPIQRFLSGDERYPLLGDDPRDTERQKIFSAAAYPFQGEPRQYLYVVLTGEAYDDMRALLDNSYFVQASLAAVFGSIIVGLLAGLYAFNLLTRRLHRLAAVMERFRHSGFREHQCYREAAAVELPQRPGDEIDALGTTFDQMATTIIEQVQALEQKESLRRNLVANVSHDLRTPLASLQGYLETLLVKEGLSEERRQEYLQTAFRHSERLTRLVGELFELSKLEAHEARPALEAVALGELLHDVAHPFRLRAAQAGIALQVETPDQLPFVRADIAMLSRVLENLLGNALAHTPHGGTISVAVAHTGAGVTATISNSGAHVAPEELPLLWERFYQAPERRHGSGAGLGLAIVKRILELHGATPWVRLDGADTISFGFTLPRWQPGV